MRIGPSQGNGKLVAGAMLFDAQGIVDVAGGDGVYGNEVFQFGDGNLIGKIIFYLAYFIRKGFRPLISPLEVRLIQMVVVVRRQDAPGLGQKQGEMGQVWQSLADGCPDLAFVLVQGFAHLAPEDLSQALLQFRLKGRKPGFAALVVCGQEFLEQGKACRGDGFPFLLFGLFKQFELDFFSRPDLEIRWSEFEVGLGLEHGPAQCGQLVRIRLFPEQFGKPLQGGGFHFTLGQFP